MYTIDILAAAIVICMTNSKTDVHVPQHNASPSFLTKKLDAESRKLAKKIDQVTYVYALYGLMDGLGLSLSMFSYLFALIPSTDDRSSSERMHDWLVTPEGVVIAAFESITLIAFSMMANIYSDKENPSSPNNSAFKRYIAIAWPYCRDSMKGLKNAYKGVRSTLLAFGNMSGSNLNYIIAPLGIALGVLSVVNRFCMRKFVIEPRKANTKINAKLLLEIKGTRVHLQKELPSDMTAYRNGFILVGDLKHPEILELFYINSDKTKVKVRIDHMDQLAKGIKERTENADSLAELQAKQALIHLSDQEISALITKDGGYIPPIVGLDEAACVAFRQQKKKTQEPWLNSLALLGAAYGGIVDGLYLYMGALALAVLSPPAFILMLSCSLIFSLLCVITRVYEEYDFQRKFHATQAKIELALCGKELEALLATLQGLSDPFKFKHRGDAALDAALNALLVNLKRSSKSPLIAPELESLHILLTTLSKPLDGGAWTAEQKIGIDEFSLRYQEIIDHEQSQFLAHANPVTSSDSTQTAEEAFVFNNPNAMQDPPAEGSEIQPEAALHQRTAILSKELTQLKEAFSVEPEKSIEQVRLLYVEKLKLAYKEELELKRVVFDTKRNELRLQVTLTPLMAGFSGIRDGLAAFSAITGLMFAVAAIGALLVVAFPPELLLVSVGFGMVSLIVLVVHSLRRHSTHLLNESNSKAIISNGKLFDLLESVKSSQRVVQDLKPEVVKDAITQGMVVDPSPQFFFQEWFEVIRSMGSGVFKGPKTVEFIESIGEGLGVVSHNDDSPVMFRISLISAFAQALTFGLRALGRGFGRDALDVVPSIKIPDSTSNLVAVPSSPRTSWYRFFPSPFGSASIIPPQQAMCPTAALI